MLPHQGIRTRYPSLGSGGEPSNLLLTNLSFKYGRYNYNYGQAQKETQIYYHYRKTNHIENFLVSIRQRASEIVGIKCIHRSS